MSKNELETIIDQAWDKNDETWAAEFSSESFIDYKIDNLSKFLRRVNEQK